MHTRLLITCIAFAFLYSCTTEPDGPTASTTEPVVKEIIPNCSFQIQGIHSLIGSNYKIVGGTRYCEDDGKATKELILFAEGEPINNHKECNLFATTDTSTLWVIEQSALKIEVQFTNHIPTDSTMLMKQETVYDSIKVFYSLKIPAES